jgi:hypothetical protein
VTRRQKPEPTEEDRQQATRYLRGAATYHVAIVEDKKALGQRAIDDMNAAEKHLRRAGQLALIRGYWDRGAEIANELLGQRVFGYPS